LKKGIDRHEDTACRCRPEEGGNCLRTFFEIYRDALAAIEPQCKHCRCGRLYVPGQSGETDPVAAVHQRFLVWNTFRGLKNEFVEEMDHRNNLNSRKRYGNFYTNTYDCLFYPVTIHQIVYGGAAHSKQLR